MATQDAPYDPYIPNSQQQQQGGNQQGGNARTQALQAVSFLMNLFLSGFSMARFLDRRNPKISSKHSISREPL